MTTYDYLIEALRIRVQEKGAFYSIEDDRSAFAIIYNDISYSLEQWQSHAVNMLSPKYWNLNRLIRDDGSLGKPKVYVTVTRTIKGNLVLEWLPWPVRHFDFRDQYDLRGTDWLWWSDTHHIGSGMTDNRILMIHSIDYLLDQEAFSSARQPLVLAIRSLLDTICSFLRSLVDIEIMDDLYVVTGPQSGQLQSVSIRSVAEVEREKEAAAKDAWLKQTFEVRLNMAPELLLQMLKDNGMKIGTVSRRIREQGVTISRSSVQTILSRLYKDYPDIYDNILKEPPSGCDRRPRKIISLRALSR